MATTGEERATGAFFVVPFVYGSTAAPMETALDGHTHRWRVYLRAIGDADDELAKVIRKVTFRLHDSFDQPIRAISSPPFLVEETGWGEFEVQIKIQLQDPLERNIQLSHFLRLYHCDDCISKAQDQRVVSEKYEELLFQGPHVHFIQMLKEFATPTDNSRLEQKEPALYGAIQRETSRVKNAIKDLQLEVEG